MRRSLPVFLLTLSLLLLFSCGGEPAAPSPAVTKVQELRARVVEVVSDVITDGERQVQLLKIADKIEKQVKKMEGVNNSTRNKVFKAYRKPETTPEDFEKIFRKHSEKRMKVVGELVALRMQMRALVSEEEWGRLAEGLEFVR